MGLRAPTLRLLCDPRVYGSQNILYASQGSRQRRISGEQWAAGRRRRRRARLRRRLCANRRCGAHALRSKPPELPRRRRALRKPPMLPLRLRMSSSCPRTGRRRWRPHSRALAVQLGWHASPGSLGSHAIASPMAHAWSQPCMYIDKAFSVFGIGSRTQISDPISDPISEPGLPAPPLQALQPLASRLPYHLLPALADPMAQVRARIRHSL